MIIFAPGEAAIRSNSHGVLWKGMFYNTLSTSTRRIDFFCYTLVLAWQYQPLSHARFSLLRVFAENSTTCTYSSWLALQVKDLTIATNLQIKPVLEKCMYVTLLSVVMTKHCAHVFQCFRFRLKYCCPSKMYRPDTRFHRKIWGNVCLHIVGIGSGREGLCFCLHSW